MPYIAEITRATPSCFLFLVDQSGSMAQPISGGDGKRKADFVADALNRLLQTLVLRCAKSDGIRDYFLVGVIGYSSIAAPALKGALTGRQLVPVSAIANHPLRVENRTRKVDDGAGGIIEQTVKFPVWFEPMAGGKTAMCAALEQSWHILSDFLVANPSCYPPVVINITDGEASDGDPEINAAMLRGLGSSDGNVLLFNLHISSLPQRPCQFPDREDGLPDDFARRLFRMSSLLPERVRGTAQAEGIETNEHSRGFVFNADLVAVVKFLEIGTRVDPRNLR